MKRSFSRYFAALACAAGLAVWAGCQKPAAPVASTTTSPAALDDHEGHDHEHGDHDHEHGDHEHGHADDSKLSTTPAAGESSPAKGLPRAGSPAVESSVPSTVIEAEEPMEEEAQGLLPADQVRSATADAETAPEETEPADPDPLPPAPGETEPAPAEEMPVEEMPAEENAATTPAKPAPTVAQDRQNARGEKKLTRDWHMWGGSPNRNMVNASTGLDLEVEPGLEAGQGKKMIFVSPLGSQTYGNPTVASGKVLVGTNNGGEYRPQHKGDRGVVLCFDAETGKFLWQLTREKLPEGRVSDWPEQGICSAPFVEGDRLWVVTNRAELMCLDMEGFHDGENDGLADEVDSEPQDADIIWSLDMINEMGVFVHNLATSSPLIVGDTVFIVTSNGVDEGHIEIPSPRAPSFIAVDKNTGEVLWEQNYPFDQILHGQWSSPALGQVNGENQIYYPGGDGWLYALSPETGDILWKFDLNPKDSKWELGGRGTRNNIIATPVFYENDVYVGVGQDPEHGEGIGHFYRIDATKKPTNEEKDVSPVIAGENEGEYVPNPDSAQVWHYGGEDESGEITGKKGADVFRRTLSTASVTPELVYVADLSGRIHCIERETGKRVWEGDILSGVWGSTMAVDGKLLLGDENGYLHVMPQGREWVKKHPKIEFESSIYTTPTIADGKMYVSDRSRLYCFDVAGKGTAPQEGAAEQAGNAEPGTGESEEGEGESGGAAVEESAAPAEGSGLEN
ncbi:MAG TPA: PQQ-binding-like beta-propeller repeat protein [Pirellulaceae bacterium]|jgi:outer membrane protein assembly factor BamB|nr:PQQ-binding-like beta-propeller repeat protein [Pirellulaceae bacterium]